MKTISVLLIAALAAVLCGCAPAVSVRPLYTDDDLKHPIVEPRIEGEWVSLDLDKVGTDDEIMFKLKIAPPERPGEPTMASDSAYHVELRFGKPDPRERRPGLQLWRALDPRGRQAFFDADFVEVAEGPVKTGSDDVPGLVAGRVIGRVRGSFRLSPCRIPRFAMDDGQFAGQFPGLEG